MTYKERSIIRLHREGYMVDSIARTLGEYASYVAFVLQSYFGYARSEVLNGRIAAIVHRS